MTTLTDQQQARTLGGQLEQHLLTAFFVVYKTARIIDENNRTFIRQCQAFHKYLKQISKDSGSVAIKTVSGRYFVNERMVRFDDTGLSGAMAVVREWKAVGLGGVVLADGIEEGDAGRLFKFMSEIKPGSDNIDELSARLKAAQLAHVKLLSAKEVNAEHSNTTEEVRREFRSAARANFFRAMNVVEETVVGLSEHKEVNVSKTKRVVHTLIDNIVRDESSLIELTAIRDYDDYTYAHSVNVCVYALTLGVRLGLDRPRLAQLGFAAIFHDAGKVKLPTDLIRKPDKFDEDDWLQMQRHPLLGAKTIMRSLKLDVHTARAARGAFEHHISPDNSGYPRLPDRKRPVNLFSRIISIVDSFDALTSGRIYIKKAIPADEVLRKMHFQMHAKFDAFLLKLFTDVVGIYPAGSLVLLSTDEVALILTNSETDRNRPYVKIIGNQQGPLSEPEWADLSLPEESARVVVRLIDPERYGLNTRDLILRD
ncbi:MAG: HD domain-containing protein [candidate division Zixibacteria bacterium]|nr:HD domain-containing protein [candidate division Zixibacteria bacterium]